MAENAPPRFLVTAPCRPGELVTLPPEQSRHLAAVLRMAPGRAVRLFTGDGQEFDGRIERADAAAATVRVDRPRAPRRPALPVVTLAFAPPPGQRGDLVVEKATELGAAALRPLVCERLQGFQAEAARRRAERWRRKAAEAARQCERPDVPQILAPVPFDEFVQGAEEGLRLIASLRARAGLWAVLSGAGRPESAGLVVGPAGGLTRRELELARGAGWNEVSLGPHVLRVETAALALLAGVVAWLTA